MPSLNRTEIIRINLSRKIALCPRCGKLGGNRHSTRKKVVLIAAGKKAEVLLSRHYCHKCERFFTNFRVCGGEFRSKTPLSTRRLAAELRWVKKLSYRAIARELEAKTGLAYPESSIYSWLQGKDLQEIKSQNALIVV